MGNKYKNEKLVQNAKSFRMVFDTIKGLRHSQGFYSRLYSDLMEDIKYSKENISNMWHEFYKECVKYKDGINGR